MNQMIKKQKLTIEVETEYSPSVISSVKNVLWEQLKVSCSIQSISFNDEPSQEFTFYFVSTNEKYNVILERLKSYFYDVLIIKKN